ncbi:MAG: gamma carbonic anhydrase family protein [Flavobacteriaceae bacterium]|jgi:carbonic anhydrase/acetyltransferase-like protein (isoleucine patch superfamily)|nr:gamma carbonic anhydrase family protein [Candidatus Arcticimaribacter sp.]MDA9360980.1 gamma carbonic anhydrase family protein [Flavobacteriaceae bacterium]MDG1057828.1 gamma carbonic anhydrase family protein [Flavobacteriaceae bacterium]MDG1091776.1 gamma carbonic anhydrase family protein [Flavobacteriaceae bacterium]
MLIKTVRGFTPQWGSDCFVAENATLIGDLIMGDQCSVWYQAVIRGDVNAIRVGNRVNIQDGAVIHATYEKAATTIGDDVSIGHNAIVHGCILKDKVLVGMGSIIMDNCIVESNSIIAAGSVVTQNTHIPEGTIYAGIPARKIKDIDPELQKGEIERIAKNYLMYSSWFKPDQK